MDKRVLITGGAGFIGSNTAYKLALKGFSVIIVDNLSRKGALTNLNWLKSQFDLVFYQCDIANKDKIGEIIAKENPDIIIHLAGQVAVTTSVSNPELDFQSNCIGTFNLLEASRKLTRPPFIIYSSTNKVYGEFEGDMIEKEKRYEIPNLPHGISEKQPLDFHSPYGCSKGAADQYVRDYSRIFGIQSVVLRQSCIYGYRQFGVEDQGWVAWFTIAACLNTPLTIYGNGKQVRDVLFIDDLADLYLLCIERPHLVSGKCYNIGGGHEFSISLLDLIDLLQEKSKKKIMYNFGDWRPGDQKVYISDIGKIKEDLGWMPRVSPEKGVPLLYEWVSENINAINRD